MEVSKRRGCVVPGSVWESRMKSDEVSGGIKVFKAEQEGDDDGKAIANATSRLRTRNSIGKRKTWKPEEECKDLIISSSSSSSTFNGIKKSPRKVVAGAEKVERRPIQTRKLRSNAQKGSEGQLRKSKSDPIKNKNCESDSIEMRKTKSDLDEVVDDVVNEVDNCESEKIDVEIEKEVMDFDACDCQDKEIASSSELENVGVVQVGDDDDDDDDNESDKEVVEVDEENENENEKESFEVKEISSISESKKVDVAVNEGEAEQKNCINEVEEEPKKVVTVSANMRFPIRKNETRRPVSGPLKQFPPPIRLRRNSTIHQPNSR